MYVTPISQLEDDQPSVTPVIERAYPLKRVMLSSSFHMHGEVYLKHNVHATILF
jgi:hypothetical protein